MTELTTNDSNSKTHFSQPLKNSPLHFNNSNNISNVSFHNQKPLNHYNNYHQKQQPSPNTLKLSSSPLKQSSPTTPLSSATNSPLHYRNPFNSPNNSPFVGSSTHINYQNSSTLSSATTTTTLQQQQLQQQQLQQQIQLQQYLYRQKLSLFNQNQYQKHLHEILQQQKQLQKILSANDSKEKEVCNKSVNNRHGTFGGESGINNDGVEADAANNDEDDDSTNDNDEISDESLKQNVAIVLNNLDRYNNALRSVILTEQINSNSSILFDDNSFINSNHNFLFNNIVSTNNNNRNSTNNSNSNGNNKNSKSNNISNKSSGNNYNNKRMATATATAAAAATTAAVSTPESDYNSNATTPGSRSNMLSYDGNLQHQQQNNLVGFNVTTAGTAVAAASASVGITSVNNIGCVGGGNGFASNNQYTNGGIGNNGFCGNMASLSNNLNCSIASSHDFSHDNSDYQWFLDYGYRDGAGGMQRSVLSSLSASYNGFGDLVLYEDLSKNLDANLAEVDMESFRAEDIHSLLSQLPSYCKNLTGLGIANGMGGEIILGGAHTSLEQSFNNLMLQQEPKPNMLPVLGGNHNMSTTSSNEPIDNSICKSELLFSPVKESHISVDSLDMDAYADDGDIILTCQANKDNYTIAFEGSILYSDESFYEPNEMALKHHPNYIKLHHTHDANLRNAMEMSLSRSNLDYTPNMNHHNSYNANQLQRCPSGNNNTNINANTIVLQRPKSSHAAIRKSSSLPNLNDEEETATAKGSQQVLNVSEAISTSTMEHCKSRNLLPMCQMPISASVSVSDHLSSICHYDDQNHYQQEDQHQHQHAHHHHHQHQHQQNSQNSHHRHKHRCCCSHSQNSTQGAVNNLNILNSQNQSTQHQKQHSNISGSASSGNSNPAAFNLVKLFIKQKSSNCSSDDGQVMSSHTCMDVSSGCWPSSDAVGSSSSSSIEQRLRKKSMHDSGKGSALSRHDEEDLCRESKDTRNDFSNEHSTLKRAINNDQVFYDEDPSSSSTGSLTATNSPCHRKRSIPLRNPQLQNVAQQTANGTSSNQSTDASHSNSEQLTQIYAASGVAATVERRRSKRSSEPQRPISTASSSEMITRSMQTSSGSLSTQGSVSDRLRCVPPSFLSKLSKLGDERQAPIYVIYPNYALPDLGFVKNGAAPEIIFSPFNYQMTIGGTSVASSSLKKHFNVSTDDDELLKTMSFKHVVDWSSLATLLPSEYRRRLRHIPQVNSILPSLEAELSHKPLFCLTPPLRRNRTTICDCATYLYQDPQERNQAQKQVQEGSSSSGSSQQPSSGYRGSSTLLTDSEVDTTADPLKQMYVYQYEQQKMDSGVETSPGSVTKPTPMPRGILRKTNVQASARTKRNSMIENQQTNLTKLEKRRSLPEPPNSYGIGSAEELAEVHEEDAELYAVPKPRKERLSRKDLDARARAESFLSSIPKSELKYYAEIAAILESSEQKVEYDAVALKKEVSRALSQQKKVSFNDEEQDLTPVQEQNPLVGNNLQKRFSTPPNSPNISSANNRANVTKAPAAVPRRLSVQKGTTLDEQEMRKIESNRFKRLQIQWELMSKDTSMLKDIVSAEATKSGGSTPTSANAVKSRIPRPVSYPAGKRTENQKQIKNEKTNQKCDKMSSKNENRKVLNQVKTNNKATIVSPRIRITGQDGKTSARSPSRIVPPKRYSIAASPNTNTGKQCVTSPATPTGQNTGTNFITTRARTPNSRVATTAPNTPKRRVQSPRSVPRVR